MYNKPGWHGAVQNKTKKEYMKETPEFEQISKSAFTNIKKHEIPHNEIIAKVALNPGVLGIVFEKKNRYLTRTGKDRGLQTPMLPLAREVNKVSVLAILKHFTEMEKFDTSKRLIIETKDLINYFVGGLRPCVENEMIIREKVNKTDKSVSFFPISEKEFSDPKKHCVYSATRPLFSLAFSEFMTQNSRVICYRFSDAPTKYFSAYDFSNLVNEIRSKKITMSEVANELNSAIDSFSSCDGKCKTMERKNQSKEGKVSDQCILPSAPVSENGKSLKNDVEEMKKEIKDDLWGFLFSNQDSQAIMEKIENYVDARIALFMSEAMSGIGKTQIK